MISSFQCEINGGIRIAPNVGAVLIAQNDVKIDFWGLVCKLGKNRQRDSHVAELFA